MNEKMLKVVFSVLLMFAVGCSTTGGGKIMTGSTVFPKGDKAPKEYFTNTVWVKMLHTDEKGVFDTQVYNVTFEPSARTYWHSHPGGQILLITKGIGYYQEKGKSAQILNEGEIVKIPPNVIHWHGAGPDCEFVHLGMSTKNNLGPAKWAGPVTDEEYSEAVAK